MGRWAVNGFCHGGGIFPVSDQRVAIIAPARVFFSPGGIEPGGLATASPRWPRQGRRSRGKPAATKDLTGDERGRIRAALQRGRVVEAARPRGSFALFDMVVARKGCAGGGPWAGFAYGSSARGSF